MLKRNILRTLSALILAMLPTSITPGHALEREDIRRFILESKLFTYCDAISVFTEPLPDEKKETGLTRKEIIDVTTGKLRIAELYETVDEHLQKGQREHKQFLNVEVDIFDKDFKITVSLHRHIDFGYGRWGYAQVWERKQTGTHGGDKQLILSYLSTILDGFTTAYLEINKAPCNTKAAQP